MSAVILYRDDDGEEREHHVDISAGETVADAVLRAFGDIDDMDYAIAVERDGKYVL